jgi:TonB family protein
MFDNALGARRPRLALHSALALLVAGCSCFVQASFAQRIGERDVHVSGRVQRLLDRARSCRANEDFDCAYAALESIPRRELSDFEQYEYWRTLGWTKFFEGNLAEAAVALRNVAEYSGTPQQQQFFIRSVAQLQASMGQFQQAYDTLEELLVLDGEIPLAGLHLTAEGLWRGLDVYVIGTWDPVPLVADQPPFPGEAVEQGLLQGYVDVDFTVTRTGATRDVTVIESSAPAFERSAIEAAEKLRYKPGLVDGEAVEAVGVQRRIQFQRQDRR